MDKCTEDTEDVADNPTKRKRWSKGEPPLMRILITGKSVSENSRVGNLILGRSAFDSEAPPDVVERVGGRLKHRHVTLINSPQLLHTHISDDQITQTVRECMILSDPGPHVVLLLLQHQQCSAEDQERVEKLQDSFSERLLQHTLVLSTQEPTEPNQILQKIIQKCSNRHFSLQTSSSADHLLQAFEDIEQSNEGRHLITAAPSGDSQCSTVEKQDTQIFSDCERLNVLVCGSDGSLKSSISELILQHTHRRSESVSADVDLHGRLINVLELPALFNTGLSEEEVMRQTLRCVSLCHPGVHAFLLIIPDAPLNNEDRAEMEEIQKIFSSRINKHIMILIMQNSEHQTAELNEETQAVIQSFGGRHHYFNPETQVSTLMENIEKMLEENRGGVYSTETFLEAQMEKLMKCEEIKKKIHSLETHFLPQDSTNNEDELRIVLLGKTGVGKSSTGNTILGRDAFKAEEYFESVTSESQRESSEINGRRITVIDTPGLFDTELSNEEIQREIRHCISMILPGPHVFLLLIPLGQRFTKEEETSVKFIQETFGESSLMFTMVLFTRGDSLKNTTIDQCLDRPGSVVRKLLEACGHRYHVFNNDQPEDRTQVSELLEKIDNMVKANGGSFYSCKMFREMEREKQEQQMKILKNRVRETEEEKERMKMKMEEERQKQEKERKTREKLKREDEKYHREMEEEMKRERDTFRNEIEVIRKEKEKIEIEKENLKTEYERELDRLKNRLENERESRDKERKRREEEREAQQKTQMSREPKEWEKQIQEEKKRREEERRRETEKQISDEQIQRHKSEVEGKIKEKKTTEREKQEQLEDSEKRLKEERKMREDKTNEENQKLLEEQHEEELIKRRVELREDYGIEIDGEIMRKICSETDDSLQGQNKGIETVERIKNLFHRLHLKRRYKLRAADVLQLSEHLLGSRYSYDEEELTQTYIQKLLMMDYRARDIRVNKFRKNQIQQREGDSGHMLGLSLSNATSTQSSLIHPMDVQMSVFHSSDGFLKQLMVTKLSQCQFALPLLVPDLETQQIEFPLWTFRQINKSWKIRNTNNETISQTQPIYKAQTPMVFFFRFGSVSSSKSQLMNSLINDKHNTFFHRNCPGSSRSRVLMDGVVEIAWFCPSGKNTDTFTDCVAFCNLHGDAGDHEKQWKILTEKASVNVVLLPVLDKDDKHAAIINNLFKNPKPLICLFTEDENTLKKMKKGKFKIGAKNRNQADVSEDLMKAITVCLSESSSTFRLEDVSKYSDIRVDEEDDEDCRRGRAAAQQMISLLEEKKLTEIKESFLPHQGKLWHQWSQKNKELHRPQAEEIEMDISRKQTEMKKIRKQQHESDISEFMKLLLKEIMFSHDEYKMFFLKWLNILLDEHTSADLSALQHKYAEKWSAVLKLKKNRDKFEKIKSEETELERISEDLQAAAFGLEHIMREIGQIYESCSSVKENKKDLPVHFSSLPSLAAEMMISGFPLELMDGDAAHVPLVWISAVFDQLVQKLGDQTRVFVLSVLGLQSSGKSTMLNAMFGLQFAVSAGRCTRGAFMQLVKVSEEMKTQMNCDYILVVDTEGLRAPELAGKSTRDHDNELATFVVGVGNMTLINIFGENPSEMQDVLQIVVQAFMRMKKVKLHPICVFVHQNVSDVTAGEKNMEGRRRLQETLDKMTKLAAEEEVYDADRFSDVIRFDVQNDVKYFAQLWEGSPPMAPPNPNYCENIQELKESILLNVSRSDGARLTHLKDLIKDLWEALLNERFVFNFRNCLEISAYRKLETEYSKWSWSLRTAMLEIENKLHKQIKDEAIYEVKETDLHSELKETNEEVEKSMTEFFEKDLNKYTMIQWKSSFEIKIKELQQNIVIEAKRKLNDILQQQYLKKKIDAQRTHHENTLYEKSKELALKLKDNTNEETLKKVFHFFWEQRGTEITRDTPKIRDIDIMRDLSLILRDVYISLFIDCFSSSNDYTDIFTVQSYSDYVKIKKSFGLLDNMKREVEVEFLSKEDEAEIKSFVTDVARQTDRMILSFDISKMGYNISLIQQLIDYIKARVIQHEEGEVKYKFKNEFFIDLVYSICKRANKTVTDQHRLFREDNDPEIYLKKKKEEYYSIFQKYCHGAASAAILGQIICQKLKELIEQSVYKKTARDLADEMKTNCESLNGNRTNLEKHILKTLAEEEDFDKYMNYIEHPRDHYKSFIRDEVSRYIRDKFSISVLPKMKENIKLLQQKIMNAAHVSTKHVQVNSGDVGLWLKSFTQQLSDQLIFSKEDLSEVKHDDVADFRLLEDVFRQELPAVMSDISSRFNTDTFPVKLDYKFRPDELLIDHICQCCWVQCPFCKATCTYSMENHGGDHSVAFHRVFGLNGQFYAGTRNLSVRICTTVVASYNCFHPNDSAESVPWRDYRRAGGVYADWSITPDLSELPYWKWFVCRFQKDLEKYYNKTFEGSGKISGEWRKYTKQDAIESLDNRLG